MIVRSGYIGDKFSSLSFDRFGLGLAVANATEVNTWVNFANNVNAGWQLWVEVAE
jgi:hypothetical protein